MENAESILVIILSIFLAVFLLLAIILLLKLIQLTNRIKAVAEKAERLTDIAESVGGTLKAAGGRFVFSRLIFQYLKNIFRQEDDSPRPKKGKH